MSAEITKQESSRPIANFHACHWGDHFLHFTSPHHDEQVHEEKKEEVKALKEQVRKELIEKKGNSNEQLNIIDTIEHLGVAYHFQQQIDDALNQIYHTFHQHSVKDDVYHLSTRFRILRQHGYPVSSDVFKKLKEENGNFSESLTKDVPGLLSLYEACHVGGHDDKILDEALVFTTNHLTSMLNNLSSPMADKVAHALHQPYHKGMHRVESRFYISMYEMDPYHNNTLLKFAKLDFNLVQALHQKELKDLRRWWKGLHLNASFSRDRLTEAYFWIIGVYYEPQYSLARKVYRKIFKSTSLLDDTYDAYGTIHELQLLTDMFQREWDIRRADELPEHVKWSYYANVEACEEASQDLSGEGKSFLVDFTREQIKALCKAYMQEAKWCNQNYVPAFDDYMKIALVTSPYPHAIISSFLGMGEIATKEVFEWASQNPMPNVIKAASTIIRLMNDMGGHKFEQKRKHVASAVQCLMEKNGLSIEEAYEKLRKQVDDAWKDINEAMLQPHVIPKRCLYNILNLARSADVIYKGSADGYTNVNQVLKEKVASILAHPIPI